MDNKVYERCQRCNRILKSEKARQRGFGECCWKIHQLELKKNKKTLLGSYILNSIKN